MSKFFAIIEALAHGIILALSLFVSLKKSRAAA